MIITKFICDMCESNENPQSTIWDELCIYCTETCHVVNLEMAKTEIRNHELGVNNRELTQKEFDTATKIKLAMSCLHSDNFLGVEEYLTDAMMTIRRG